MHGESADENIEMGTENGAAGVVDDKPAIMYRAIGKLQPIILLNVYMCARRHEAAFSFPLWINKGVLFGHDPDVGCQRAERRERKFSLYAISHTELGPRHHVKS